MKGPKSAPLDVFGSFSSMYVVKDSETINQIFSFLSHSFFFASVPHSKFMLHIIAYQFTKSRQKTHQALSHTQRSNLGCSISPGRIEIMVGSVRPGNIEAQLGALMMAESNGCQ